METKLAVVKKATVDCHDWYVAHDLVSGMDVTGHCEELMDAVNEANEKGYFVKLEI